MRGLPKKELVVLNMLWKHGPMFVKEIQELYPDPKPHVNTVSTQVRFLESKGLVTHKSFGGSYRYEAAVSEKEYGNRSISAIVKEFLGDSYMSAVSALVRDKKITVDELKDLIDQIEQGK